MDGDALSGSLLVQVAAREPHDPVPLVRRDNAGLVFTGQGALFAARTARRQGFDGPVLVDRRRYAGPSRIRGTAPLSRTWLAEQRDLGATAVLSDSGYIGAGDREALDAVLGQAADADAIAVLPLHPRWLRQDRAALRGRLVAHSGPIALVLEHSSGNPYRMADPFGSREALSGLISVLGGPVPAGLLGGDVSALTVLAYGGAWAAIGIRPALRHLHPQEARVDRLPHERVALVDPLLTIAPVGRIAKLSARSPDDPLWICRCRVCHRRSLGWLQDATDLESNAHTFNLLQQRRNRLMTVPAGERRVRYWEKQCRDALRNYDELRVRYRGWEAPAWLEMIGQNP